MKKNTIGFTLVELLVYAVVSVIITYGIFYIFESISHVVKSSHKYITVYEQIDELQSSLGVIDSQYKNYFYSTGTIFSQSESGFQACVYTDDTNQKGIIVGAINKATQSIITGNISVVDEYIPFIAQIGSGGIDSIGVNNKILPSILSESAIVYFDVNLLKMTCNKKPLYTKFDLVVIPDVKQSDFGTQLSTWEKKGNRKISLSFIK